MLKRIISILLSVFLIVSACTLAVTASIKDIAKDSSHISESKSSIDHAEFADTLTASLADTQHPYILYSNDEIPELREKVNYGLSKKAYERVMATSQGYLNKSFAVSKSSNGIIGRQLQCYISYLSTASAISGDEQYAQKAIEIILSAAEQGNTEIYLAINGALCLSDFGHAYALAYDCLYNYMDDSQRSAIKEEMIEIGTWIFENSDPDNSDSWGADVDRRKAWNWNAVTHGALGLIALSLGDQSDWLALALRRATDYFDLAVDDTGAAMEGLHYLGYGLNSMVPFDAAIYRLSGTELMDDYPEIQLMPAWSNLYMTLPQGNAQASIGQGSKMDNHAAPFYIINRYSLSEELWGFYNTYNLWDDNDFAADYEGNGWNCPAIIFYEDQTLTPIKPNTDDYPLIKEFDKGLVITRDSWDSDASMVTFTCGVGFLGCWNHPDDNTFTFSAKGDKYIIDLGAGKLTSAEHNTVLIDGVGMSYDGGPIMRPGDLQEVTVLENGNLYLRGNNLSSYWKSDIKISMRHLVYGDGETPFVLVYDHIRKDTSNHDFSINFYTDPNAEVEVSSNARYATITGALNGEKCYVIPMSDEFVFVEAEKSAGINRITTQSNVSAFAQATLFIMAEPDGSMPDYDYGSEGKNFWVTITRTHNGEKVTETYVFGTDRFISFETDESLTIDPPPSTDESDTVETDTSAEIETTVTETDTTAIETETNVTETETTVTETETTVTETETTVTETETTVTETETTVTETETTVTETETTESETEPSTESSQETESIIETDSSEETESTDLQETSSSVNSESEESSQRNDSSDTEKTSTSAESSGCGSFASISLLPIIVATIASVTVIRKKND